MQPEDVGAEAGQEHVLFEMVLVDLLLEMLAQFAFAEDHESGVRYLLHDEVRRLDQVPLAFVRHERRDVADDRRLMGQPERFVHVDRRPREHVLDVDALVHRHRPIVGHAVGDEHLADRLRRGDEAVDLPVLPP